MPVVVLALFTCGLGCATKRPAATSQWVHAGYDGKLVYKATDKGDRIMDFSHAGYGGGGVALPNVPVKVTVTPTGGEDDTPVIQAAIDSVSKASPGTGGFRGAVLLGPGTFTCSKSIALGATGIVLRGSGSGGGGGGGGGAGGTTIKMVGRAHRAITIGSDRGRQVDSGNEPAENSAPFVGAKTIIADAYVPAGTNGFTVADANGFAVGDHIAISRPTTPAWVHLMGMDTLKRDGKPQTWIATSRHGVTERTIAAIDGNRITVDVPLADSYDAMYLNPPGTTVSKIKPAARVTRVGVENLRIQCPPIESAYGQHPYAAVRVGGDDCWVRDVVCDETMNSTVLAGRRITMQNVVIHHTYPNLGASKPSDFSIEGSQILIDRCASNGGNTYWVWTGSLIAGPNVVLNSVFRGHGSRIQPHQRWATGLLLDNCTVPDGGIDFPNRGVAGSGHGWTMGWGVAWNCIADFYVIQQPPGTVNWAIGCIGDRVKTARYFDTAPILSEGVFDSYGTPVAPASLYLSQLQERLGPQALTNIGYAANDAAAFAKAKATKRLPPLKTEPHPQLGPDLALHRPLTATEGRGDRAFAGERAVDADEQTYWWPADDATRITFEIDLEGPVDINALEIREAKEMPGRIKGYKVEAQVDSDWTLLSEGTTVGDAKIDRFPKVTAWKVRLTITKHQGGAPAVRKFGLYLDARPSAN